MDLSIWRRRTAVAAAALGLLLTACGGGGGSSSGDTGGSSSPGSAAGGDASPEAAAAAKPTHDEAMRFLSQATFGSTEAEVKRVIKLGYSAWLDDQFAKPAYGHLASWDAADAALKKADATKSAGQREVFDGFYQQAIRGDDALRGRVALALSEIFVVSLQNGAVGEYPRGVAAYLDMLGDKGFGTYRGLLEAVARHPMMGLYLSHLRNQKEDPATGRVPDENFAREVMQLMSIGLFELNADGTARLDADGQPIETYGAKDISGLARVFTGWSWAGKDTSDARFWGWDSNVRDPKRSSKPMQAYPQFHSTSAKRFLGVKIAANTSAEASLKKALDTLAAHPNVGPFIGHQLIQRLVTSNPSPAYVGRVAAAFADNGSGQRGDMKAVIRAVLLDSEARSAKAAASTHFGKLREPVLRLTALLRAFPTKSDSGQWLVGDTDSVVWGLGQSPLRAPSVFNFFRPGYVPPNTRAGKKGLAVPEMQITHETTVAGYANFLIGALYNGVGWYGPDWKGKRPDVRIDLSDEAALADQPDALVERVTGRLLGERAGAELKAQIRDAVATVWLPALAADGSNKDQVKTQKLMRARAAVAITLVSPEFIVQK